MKYVITLVLLLAAATTWGYDAGSGCVACHGNRETMKSEGAEDMYLDPLQVDKEVGMKGAPTCVDCHLGDPTQKSDRHAAHKGLLRPFLVGVGKQVKGEAVSREEVGALKPLVPRGNGIGRMIPNGDPHKMEQAGVKNIAGIQWHDRDPKTMAYSPKVAEQTCGRCHDKETADYNRSAKGLLKHQRAFRSWAEKLPGPQNCGIWFGQNYDKIKSETTVPYNTAQNGANERACNICHASCNDCHYRPFAGAGRHSFGAPDTQSCYGGGRASVCHAGPMDRRRGAGFVRGAYAFPTTLTQGAHVKAGVQCLDCHKPVNHQFGHLASDKTRNTCINCHANIATAVRASSHSNVDCTACHITVSGAYQFTFWGQGNTSGVETPYGKHKEYYGTRDLPTIIKNAAGRWIPVKPYPMAVLNQTLELGTTGLLFRSIPNRTVAGNPAIGEPVTFQVARAATDVNDAFIVVGTRKDLPGGGNNAILWIQMDKLSHAMGKARECGTCHDSHAQVSRSQWTYEESKDVTRPFSGSYTVTADRNGIRFSDLVWSEIVLAPNRKLQDIAPFAVLPRDAWNVKGINLSLPFDERKTAAARKELAVFLATLEKRKDMPDTGAIRAVAYHNLKMAKNMLARK